jgi:thiamine kinase-like enzyme
MLSLVGHSGCELVFLKKDDKRIIRKISRDVSYNQRLELQCLKQKQFFHRYIKSPKVLDSGFINNLYYFDMEYINGLKFNDFVRTKNFCDIKAIFDILLNFIFENFSNLHENKTSVILEKIASIEISNLIDVNSILHLKSLAEHPVNIGYCHGDLTFENIIISDNNIFLIDFLDSFIESPIIDISKLMQEFDLNWSNRNDSTLTNLSVIRNIFLKRMLINKLSNYDINENSVLLQNKLTLMRILPYTKSINLKLKLINLINN